MDAARKAKVDLDPGVGLAEAAQDVGEQRGVEIGHAEHDAAFDVWRRMRARASSLRRSMLRA